MESEFNVPTNVPITQGLRGLMMVATLGLSKRVVDGLLAECDNIDALHRSLEEENAKLHKEIGKRDLAKAVGETTVEVKMYLDFKTLARELESAAQAVYSVGMRFADMKDGDDDE